MATHGTASLRNVSDAKGLSGVTCMSFSTDELGYVAVKKFAAVAQSSGLSSGRTMGLSSVRQNLRKSGGSVRVGISRNPKISSALFTATEEKYFMDSPKMKEMIAFLEKDLPHLFDEQGIDKSMYDEKVDFVDPITKYDSLEGYLFNIQMLRRLFSPIFELHKVKQTGPTDITTRWTMTMTFVLLPWRPQLLFTGTSVMTVNPKTGKFCSHVDYWDSIKSNDYFSTEGLLDVMKQLQVYKTPDLETPIYTSLKRTAVYEVRQYEQFLVAETASGGVAGNKGFNDVAGYLFGKNTTGEKMKMTTPVFNQSLGSESQLQFVLPLSTDLSTVPTPLSEEVKLRSVDKTFAAVIKFNGESTEEVVRQKEALLRTAVTDDGLKPEEGYVLARYNDPGRTRPFFRRNEVIIWLEEFQLEV